MSNFIKHQTRFRHDLTFLEPVNEISLQSLQTKTGEILFRVVFQDEIGKTFGYSFAHLSSAFDFITSNFRQSYKTKDIG